MPAPVKDHKGTTMSPIGAEREKVTHNHCKTFLLEKNKDDIGKRGLHRTVGGRNSWKRE